MMSKHDRRVTTMIGGGQKRWEECSDDRRSAIMMGVTTVGIGNHDVGQPLWEGDNHDGRWATRMGESQR